MCMVGYKHSRTLHLHHRIWHVHGCLQVQPNLKVRENMWQSPCHDAIPPVFQPLHATRTVCSHTKVLLEPVFMVARADSQTAASMTAFLLCHVSNTGPAQSDLQPDSLRAVLQEASINCA